MAKLNKCDGCNKVSPDENGMHIANKWTDILIDAPRSVYGFESGHRISLCGECLPLPDNPYSVEVWAKSIINFFMGRMK